VNPYNGYPERQRNRIMGPLKRMLAEDPMRGAGHPCAICGDPERPGGSWHSEDYSEPFILGPPATYPICNPCHGRLHKRFNQAHEWHLFLLHVRRGGYGREFAKSYSLAQRKAWLATLKRGEIVDLPRIRPRALTGGEWWQQLTLDPESLVAPWARPRPLRPRPTIDSFRRALVEIRLGERQMAILRFHAARPRRSVTMRAIAQSILRSERPTDANREYGKVARQLCERTGFAPDLRKSGSEIWMSAIAEGWQPDEREFEWVMVPTLALAIG
jgi:hypothetical protein